MINHTDKLIFFHIPKTAGLSVGNYLGTYGEGARTDHRTLYEVLPIGEVFFRYSSRLDTYLLKKFVKNELIDRKRYSLKIFKEYQKIAVVRNPFSRVVSWYKNVLSDQNHLLKHGGNKEISFEEFISNYLETSWALRSQLDWISTKDRRYEVDHIIKYEDLPICLTDLTKKLGIITSGNLPEYHRAKRYDWSNYYKDSKTKLRVLDYYKEEFERFSYPID